MYNEKIILLLIFYLITSIFIDIFRVSHPRSDKSSFTDCEPHEKYFVVLSESTHYRSMFTPY